MWPFEQVSKLLPEIATSDTIDHEKNITVPGSITTSNETSNDTEKETNKHRPSSPATSPTKPPLATQPKKVTTGSGKKETTISSTTQATESTSSVTHSPKNATHATTQSPKTTTALQTTKLKTYAPTSKPETTPMTSTAKAPVKPTASSKTTEATVVTEKTTKPATYAPTAKPEAIETPTTEAATLKTVKTTVAKTTTAVPLASTSKATSKQNSTSEASDNTKSENVVLSTKKPLTETPNVSTMKENHISFPSQKPPSSTATPKSSRLKVTPTQYKMTSVVPTRPTKIMRPTRRVTPMVPTVKKPKKAETLEEYEKWREANRLKASLDKTQKGETSLNSSQNQPVSVEQAKVDETSVSNVQNQVMSAEQAKEKGASFSNVQDQHVPTALGKQTEASLNNPQNQQVPVQQSKEIPTGSNNHQTQLKGEEELKVKEEQQVQSMPVAQNQRNNGNMEQSLAVPQNQQVGKPSAVQSEQQPINIGVSPQLPNLQNQMKNTEAGPTLQNQGKALSDANSGATAQNQPNNTPNEQVGNDDQNQKRPITALAGRIDKGGSNFFFNPDANFLPMGSLGDIGDMPQLPTTRDKAPLSIESESSSAPVNMLETERNATVNYIKNTTAPLKQSSVTYVPLAIPDSSNSLLTKPQEFGPIESYIFNALKETYDSPKNVTANSIINTTTSAQHAVDRVAPNNIPSSANSLLTKAQEFGPVESYIANSLKQGYDSQTNSTDNSSSDLGNFSNVVNGSQATNFNATGEKAPMVSSTQGNPDSGNASTATSQYFNPVENYLLNTIKEMNDSPNNSTNKTTSVSTTQHFNPVENYILNSLKEKYDSVDNSTSKAMENGTLSSSAKNPTVDSTTSPDENRLGSKDDINKVKNEISSTKPKGNFTTIFSQNISYGNDSVNIKNYDTVDSGLNNQSLATDNAKVYKEHWIHSSPVHEMVSSIEKQQGELDWYKDTNTQTSPVYKSIHQMPVSHTSTSVPLAALPMILSARQNPQLLENDSESSKNLTVKSSSGYNESTANLNKNKGEIGTIPGSQMSLHSNPAALPQNAIDISLLPKRKYISMTGTRKSLTPEVLTQALQILESGNEKPGQKGKGNPRGRTVATPKKPLRAGKQKKAKSRGKKSRHKSLKNEKKQIVHDNHQHSKLSITVALPSSGNLIDDKRSSIPLPVSKREKTSLQKQKNSTGYPPQAKASESISQPKRSKAITAEVKSSEEDSQSIHQRRSWEKALHKISSSLQGSNLTIQNGVNSHVTFKSSIVKESNAKEPEGIIIPLHRSSQVNQQKRSWEKALHKITSSLQGSNLTVQNGVNSHVTLKSEVVKDSSSENTKEMKDKRTTRNNSTQREQQKRSWEKALNKIASSLTGSNLTITNGVNSHVTFKSHVAKTNKHTTSESEKSSFHPSSSKKVPEDRIGKNHNLKAENHVIKRNSRKASKLKISGKKLEKKRKKSDNSKVRYEKHSKLLKQPPKKSPRKMEHTPAKALTKKKSILIATTNSHGIEMKSSSHIVDTPTVKRQSRRAEIPKNEVKLVKHLHVPKKLLKYSNIQTISFVKNHYVSNSSGGNNLLHVTSNVTERQLGKNNATKTEPHNLPGTNKSDSDVHLKFVNVEGYEIRNDTAGNNTLNVVMNVKKTDDSTENKNRTVHDLPHNAQQISNVDQHHINSNILHVVYNVNKINNTQQGISSSTASNNTFDAILDARKANATTGIGNTNSLPHNVQQINNVDQHHVNQNVLHAVYNVNRKNNTQQEESGSAGNVSSNSLHLSNVSHQGVTRDQNGTDTLHVVYNVRPTTHLKPIRAHAKSIVYSSNSTSGKLAKYKQKSNKNAQKKSGDDRSLLKSRTSSARKTPDESEGSDKASKKIHKHSPKTVHLRRVSREKKLKPEKKAGYKSTKKPTGNVHQQSKGKSMVIPSKGRLPHSNKKHKKKHKGLDKEKHIQSTLKDDKQDGLKDPESYLRDAFQELSGVKISSNVEDHDYNTKNKNNHLRKQKKKLYTKKSKKITVNDSGTKRANILQHSPKANHTQGAGRQLIPSKVGILEPSVVAPTSENNEIADSEGDTNNNATASSDTSVTALNGEKEQQPVHLKLKFSANIEHSGNSNVEILGGKVSKNVSTSESDNKGETRTAGGFNSTNDKNNSSQSATSSFPDLPYEKLGNSTSGNTSMPTSLDPASNTNVSNTTGTPGTDMNEFHEKINRIPGLEHLLDFVKTFVNASGYSNKTGSLASEEASANKILGSQVSLAQKPAGGTNSMNTNNVAPVNASTGNVKNTTVANSTSEGLTGTQNLGNTTLNGTTPQNSSLPSNATLYTGNNSSLSENAVTPYGNTTVNGLSSAYTLNATSVDNKNSTTSNVTAPAKAAAVSVASGLPAIQTVAGNIHVPNKIQSGSRYDSSVPSQGTASLTKAKDFSPVENYILNVLNQTVLGNGNGGIGNRLSKPIIADDQRRQNQQRHFASNSTTAQKSAPTKQNVGFSKLLNDLNKVKIKQQTLTVYGSNKAKVSEKGKLQFQPQQQSSPQGIKRSKIVNMNIKASPTKRNKGYMPTLENKSNKSLHKRLKLKSQMKSKNKSDLDGKISHTKTKRQTQTPTTSQSSNWGFPIRIVGNRIDWGPVSENWPNYG